MVRIFGAGDSRSVTVANCGDSRAVLCRNGTAGHRRHHTALHRIAMCRCVLRVSEAVELSEDLRRANSSQMLLAVAQEGWC